MPGGHSDRMHSSSFSAFLPAGRPRYTLSVMVRGARIRYQGSELAAPLARDIAADLMGLDGLPPRPGAPRLPSMTVPFTAP